MPVGLSDRGSGRVVGVGEFIDEVGTNSCQSPLAPSRYSSRRLLRRHVSGVRFIQPHVRRFRVRTVNQPS